MVTFEKLILLKHEIFLKLDLMDNTTNSQGFIVIYRHIAESSNEF